MRGHSSISSRSTAGITSSKIQSESSHMDNNSQRGMKSCSALICCITPKYLQSENCITDLKLADSLNKPVIAILLRFSSWPPEGSPPSVKRLLSKCTEVIEMYNDKLYRQNMTQLVDRTSRVLSGSWWYLLCHIHWRMILVLPKTRLQSLDFTMMHFLILLNFFYFVIHCANTTVVYPVLSSFVNHATKTGSS